MGSGLEARAQTAWGVPWGARAVPVCCLHSTSPGRAEPLPGAGCWGGSSVGEGASSAEPQGGCPKRGAPSRWCLRSPGGWQRGAPEGLLPPSPAPGSYLSFVMCKYPISDSSSWGSEFRPKLLFLFYVLEGYPSLWSGGPGCLFSWRKWWWVHLLPSF